MRHVLTILFLTTLTLAACQGQHGHETSAEPADTSHETTTAATTAAATQTAARDVTDQEAELGCGLCTFHMKDVTQCVPAVKVADKLLKLDGPETVVGPYQGMVLCSGAVTAHVDGRIEGDTFVASAIRVDEKAE